MERKTPWHLWVVGILSLLWNALGALDFTMSTTRNATYMSALTAEQQAYIYGFPLWAVVFWGMGTWGCFLGSVLLLLRSRHAVPVFAVSVIGLIGTTVFQYTSDAPDSFNSTEATLLSVFIWVITLALMYYALRMRKAGVLR